MSITDLLICNVYYKLKSDKLFILLYYSKCEHLLFLFVGGKMFLESSR